MINWEDFDKVDIRVGTVTKVKEFPNAKKAAWQLEIDFGSLGIKKSSAQITNNYDKKELLGRQVLAVVNFPPKQIANFFSECLVLGAPDSSGSIVLLKPDGKPENGVQVT